MRRKSARTLLDDYPSFAHLVLSVVTAEGTVMAVRNKTGLDHSTILKWINRRTKNPEPALVAKFLRAYPIGDLRSVLQLIHRDTDREALNEPNPLPDLSHIKPGPRPRQSPPSTRARPRDGKRSAANRGAIWPAR